MKLDKVICCLFCSLFWSCHNDCEQSSCLPCSLTQSAVRLTSTRNFHVESKVNFDCSPKIQRFSEDVKTDFMAQYGPIFNAGSQKVKVCRNPVESQMIFRPSCFTNAKTTSKINKGINKQINN